MQKNKWFIALLMAVLMIGSLFSATPTIAADSSAPVVYSWDTSITTTPEAWAAWQNWAKQYYPDIVNFDPPKSAGGWGSYVNKVVLSSTTKERWDAVPSGVSRFAAEWGMTGTVRPVMDLINKANANNLKQLLLKRPDWVKVWSYNGKLMGIPYGGKPPADNQAFAWRTDVLKKCGFSSPPKTIAALEQFCAAVKKNFPGMIPIGMPYYNLAGDLNYPLAGAKGWYCIAKDGSSKGLNFSEQYGFPAVKELNKFYRNGWMSVDTDVASQSNGNYIRQGFQAGKFAVVLAGYGVNTWGETYYQMKKTHPSWGPTIAKDIFAGPKGTGRTSVHDVDNQLAVMFSATDIGNEAAQIRLVKYLDWMWNPKNLWWYIPQKIGPNGWAATYKIDAKANKVEIASQKAKAGFGNGAGAMGCWLADDWTRVEKITAKATIQTKLAEAARKIIQQAPKQLINLPYFPEASVPGLEERFPAANGAMWGGTFDKLVWDISKNDAQLLQAYRDWLKEIKTVGGFEMMDELFKAMEKMMTPEDWNGLKPYHNYES